MRKAGYLVSALLLLAVALGSAFAQQPFADVPTDHWAYNAVASLAEQGLLEGYPDGTFGGQQSLTRYEFAQAIARMMDRMEEMGGVHQRRSGDRAGKFTLSPGTKRPAQSLR